MANLLEPFNQLKQHATTLAHAGGKMLADDPLWYKDAIIYELHVRAFADSNGDGIGDFQGLISKLDYIASLGVTCLWLLPFYPSPLRDDGYDIADYRGIHSNYGTLKDFRQFVKEAHARGIRVITELVINHTSDQHPWFQAARRAKPGSAQRDFYVWSDTNQKFPETRIIFSDTERSNWTWDDEAGAYYWHRFFSHQPDLNHNNPKVVKAVSKFLRFWLDMGVDGLRLDAVPYLCVREGTNNENLPETHEAIRMLRKEVDDHYTGKLLLAEANQWPEDVRAYFGDGDECHMAFHFPLMPRMFMAIRKADRHPITEIIARTPAIPDNCQWGLFLRNHDELTLEMVTDEERDYMYQEYAVDPRMRVNVGIRRRLAPLVENNEATIQLLNSLLFSFPGTPILYYGDEIGMGDNIYLGDRDGVRTPMQWSVDRNAGFSNADPARLYHPVIMDPVYGYQAVNVEAQERSGSSLLNFMKRIIALRKQYKAFGRGSIEFLHPANRKILAYIRRYKREVILCVVNLGNTIQPVELDLKEFNALTPMEMFGRTEFPAIGELPYFLTLAPHSFYWFKLEAPSEPVQRPMLALRETTSAVPDVLSNSILDLAEGSDSLWESGNRLLLERDLLPAYLPRQHWYPHPGVAVAKARITDWAKIGAKFYFAWVEVNYEDGIPAETFVLPLKLSTGLTATTLLQESPDSILCKVQTRQGAGVLFDAMLDETACNLLLSAIEDERYYATQQGGRLVASSQLKPQELATPHDGLTIRLYSPPDGDATVFFGNWMSLKVYRRLESANGPNPAAEVRDYLLNEPGFKHLSRICGSLSYQPPGGRPGLKLGLLKQYVENEGDARLISSVLLKTYFNTGDDVPAGAPIKELPEGERLAAMLKNAPSAHLTEMLGDYATFYRRIGERLANLHQALAAPGKASAGRDSSGKAFTPEAMKSGYLKSLAEKFSRQARETLSKLDAYANGRTLPETQAIVIRQLLLEAARIDEHFHRLAEGDGQHLPLNIRCHGNLHLGNVLKTQDDLIFTGFGGLRRLPLNERRAKKSPLADVATLLASIHYVSASARYKLAAKTMDKPEAIEAEATRLAAKANAWQHGVGSLFLQGYFAQAGNASFLPADIAMQERLLSAFILHEAFRKLEVDLQRQPAHLPVTLACVQHFLAVYL